MFERTGDTPVLDALMSPKEPKTGASGTMSWTVDVLNPSTGDDFVLGLKELSLPGRRAPPLQHVARRRLPARPRRPVQGPVVRHARDRPGLDRLQAAHPGRLPRGPGRLHGLGPRPAPPGRCSPARSPTSPG
ncbi:MAG: hypothetical protein U5K43_11695 [Halofilum sp. (in: g-proteobacteria)]|nr:hypothetical protein [Halofilum sp. (in: g-proteobacteria)]